MSGVRTVLTSQFVAVRGHADLEDAEAEAGPDDGHTSGAEVPDTNGDSYDYAADEADGDYDPGDRGKSRQQQQQPQLQQPLPQPRQRQRQLERTTET